MNETNEMEKPLVQNTSSDSNNTDEIQTIHWTRMNNWAINKWLTNPHPHMLLPGGKTILKNRPIKKSNKVVGTEFYYVVFDEEYVIAWLSKTLFTHLQGVPYNKLQQLMSAAMKRMESHNKHGKMPSQVVRGRSVD